MRPNLLWLVLPAALLAFLSSQPLHAYNPANRDEYLAKIKEAKAVFDDRCKKVAGIKIYRTVPEVEGILLLKIRPERTDRELFDPMWPGAAFGGEDQGDSYIRSFLGYEHSSAANGSPVTPLRRGYINTDKRPASLPGYRWVEVIDPKDGQRYRYALEYKEVTHISSVTIGGNGKPFTVREYVLDKSPAPKAMPRYGVTFEDHVIPEERALWLASGTIKVLDLKTNEVLGEWTRYAMSYIHRPGGGLPWLNHSVCPTIPGGAGTKTRQFVDQILIPKREK